MRKITYKVAFSYLKKQADLNPPLGYPGGICHVVNRVEEKIRNPRLEDRIVDMVERGSLPNNAAAKIYPRMEVKGVWKYPLVLSSHVQYRMDLREVTLPEIRAAIGSYFRDMNKQRSRGDKIEWEKFLSGQDIVIEDRKLGRLVIVFNKKKDRVFVVSAYRKGEPDPKGPCLSKTV